MTAEFNVIITWNLEESLLKSLLFNLTSELSRSFFLKILVLLSNHNFVWGFIVVPSLEINYPITSYPVKNNFQPSECRCAERIINFWNKENFHEKDDAWKERWKKAALAFVLRSRHTARSRVNVRARREWERQEWEISGNFRKLLWSKWNLTSVQRLVQLGGTEVRAALGDQRKAVVFFISLPCDATKNSSRAKTARNTLPRIITSVCFRDMISI